MPIAIRGTRGNRYCARPGCTNPTVAGGLYCSTTCYTHPTKPIQGIAPAVCGDCGSAYQKLPHERVNRCKSCRAARKKAANLVTARKAAERRQP